MLFNCLVCVRANALEVFDFWLQGCYECTCACCSIIVVFRVRVNALELFDFWFQEDCACTCACCSIIEVFLVRVNALICY